MFVSIEKHNTTKRLTDSLDKKSSQSSETESHVNGFNRKVKEQNGICQNKDTVDDQRPVENIDRSKQA